MLPYKNPDLDIEKRLDDLISRMTLEELICQTDQYSSNGLIANGEVDEKKLPEMFRGMSVGSVQVRPMHARISNALQRYAVEQTRLGIPFLFSEEALHGVSMEGSTCFPQQIGLAATFDPALGRAMGRAMATEARSRGIHETFSPVMDLGRDPRWGRTEESYGEDTHLSAEFARETVLGLQGGNLKNPDAVASEPKHYTAYGSPVAGLNCAPCSISRHEVFSDAQPVFEAAIKDAGAMNVMCSYTAVGNTPVSMDHELLTDVLREQWGMRGFVRSDMTAVSRLWDWFFITENEEEAIKLGMEAGVDLQLFDFPHETWQTGIKALVESGRMDRSVPEQAARRVLRVKMMLGLFENPYVEEGLEDRVVHCPEHIALAQRIAEKSIVLLKNEGNLLPLSRTLKTVAVIGPCADKPMLGDYTDRNATGVTVLEGLREMLPEAEILHEPGCFFLENRPESFPKGMLLDEEGVPGLTARYYNKTEPAGDPVFTRREDRIDHNWSILKPNASVSDDRFSVCWTGMMVCSETVDGWLGLCSEDDMRLFIDDQLLIDGWGERKSADRLVPFRFVEGEKHTVRVEFTNSKRGTRVIFGWKKKLEDFTAAVEAAKKAEVAIVCVGESNELSGENFDRISLDLPFNQLPLVKAIHAAGTPVVLVLQSGRPVSCTWEDAHLPAIVQCWFPGEMGGHAIARTLFGENNPSGRLPVTFPKHVGQVPCHYTRRPGGGRKYVEMSWLPLYPFGFGLSYTDFAYRNLELSAAEIQPGESITAKVTVANTGSRPGTAVPQLYIRDWVSSTVKPLIALAAFTRVDLQPGEEKTVELTITERAMRTLTPQYKWVVEPGKFTLYLGESSEKLHLDKTFFVK